MIDRDPRAFRASLDARLVTRAAELTVDVNRLRRNLVFQRILARLALDGGWVLKGGYALEARLGGRARSTRDLDLANVDASLEDVRDRLEMALERGVDGDCFHFVISAAREIKPDLAGTRGYRLSVTARLAGRDFALISVDVVVRADEIDGAVGTLRVPAPIAVAGLPDVMIPAVDVAQHAAEKLHALARRYAGDRPSTRVKDLVDLVLLIEAELLPDPRLGERLERVYEVRDGAPPPNELPDPPAAWATEYPSMARDLSLVSDDLGVAVAMVRGLYRDAMRAGVP